MRKWCWTAGIAVLVGCDPHADVKTLYKGPAGTATGEATATGDYDGDGRFDVLVAASKAHRGYVIEAAALTAGVAAIHDVGFVIDGSDLAPGLGYSAADATDSNGDGIHDLVLGARPEDEETAIIGAVLLGPIRGDRTVHAGDTLLTAPGDLGYRAAVFAAGDLDNDGADDIAVGLPTGDVVALIHGPLAPGPHPVDTSAHRLVGPESSGSGSEAIVAGDVDGDGIKDLIVGSPWADDTCGAAHIVYGPVQGEVDLLDQPTVTGDGCHGAEIGATLSPAGDRNADGYADIAVGAPAQPLSDDGYTGAVAIVSGPVRGDVVFHDAETVAYGTPGSRFGQAIASIGDDNRDSFDDLAIGAPDANDGAGHVVFLPGGIVGQFDARDLPVLGAIAMPGDQLGQALTTVPTADGPTLIVGAPGLYSGGGGALVVEPGW